eukprot:1301939-Rhodomonas_salina.1
MSARSRQDSAKRQMAQTAPSSSRAWSDRENAKSKHNELLLFLVTHFPDPEHLQRYPLVAGSCLIVFAVHIRAQDQLQQLKRMRELRTVSPVFGAAAYDRKMSSFWKLWSHRSRTRSFAEVFRFTKSFHQVRRDRQGKLLHGLGLGYKVTVLGVRWKGFWASELVRWGLQPPDGSYPGESLSAAMENDRAHRSRLGTRTKRTSEGDPCAVQCGAHCGAQREGKTESPSNQESSGQNGVYTMDP